MTAPRVVVGASHAGGELAARLRQLDPDVPVIMIGDEAVLPYQRPPLSKGWLGDPAAQTDALLIRNAAAYAHAGIEVRTGVRVGAIEPAARRLLLDGGETLAYRQLALATGARPRRLATPDVDRAEQAPNFHYLRALADAERLRPRLTAGARIVVIGGGYIGLELASLAIKRGLRPVVLEAQPRVLARVTAPLLSAFYEQVHRDAGVDVRTAVQVTGFEFGADGAMRGVLWQDAAGGTGCIEADLVVAGVGVVPNMELAAPAGIACAADGIRVDAHCRTSDPATVAAGDCSSRPVPGQPGTSRIESVPNATEQARAAAATLCAQDQPCNGVPWFWSDQFDLKLQMAGLSRGYDDIAVRGDPAARQFTVFYLREGRLVAADAVNRPADFMAARRLIAAGAQAAAARLSDPATDLKTLMPA